MIYLFFPKLLLSVPPHQDSTFLYTDPPSAVGLWFALENCTSSNGCLSFVPGSHKRYPVFQRWVRDSLGSKLKMEQLVPAPPEPEESEWKVEEVTAGIYILDINESFKMNTKYILYLFFINDYG